MKKFLCLVVMMFAFSLLVGCELPQAELMDLLSEEGSKRISTDGEISDVKSIIDPIDTDKEVGKEENNEQTNEETKEIDIVDHFFYPDNQLDGHHSNGIKEAVYDYFVSQGNENSDFLMRDNYVPSRSDYMDACTVQLNDEFYFFVYFFGKLYPVCTTTAKTGYDFKFIHFALYEPNNTGDYTLWVSLNIQSREEATCYSYVSIIDSKSEQVITLDPIKDRFAYFKDASNIDSDCVDCFAEKCYVGVYVTDDGIYSDEYDNANTLIKTYVRNPYHYSFSQDVYEVGCDLFKATITIEFDNKDFVVYALEDLVQFRVNVKMTYLGPTFTYDSSNTYLEAATCVFINQENKDAVIKYDIDWMSGQAITEFTIETYDEIERTYTYTINPSDVVEGCYDMVISYGLATVTINYILKVAPVFACAY